MEGRLGVVILLTSARAFRRRGRGRPSGEIPGWLARLDQTHWLLAVLVGAFMLTYSLTLAAAAEILKANVSVVDATVAYVVFALASIVTIVAPVIIAFVAPDRSDERLAQWRSWLMQNSRVIGLVALMVIGALLIVRGAYDLSA